MSSLFVILCECVCVCRITASVTFLPLIEERSSFDLLVYTDRSKGDDHDHPIPIEWEDSDARLVTEGREVQLRSFSTNLHHVHTAVQYKVSSST